MSEIRMRIDKTGQLWYSEFGRLTAKWCYRETGLECGPHCAVFRESRGGQSLVTVLLYCQSPSLVTYQCGVDEFVDDRGKE